MIAQFEFTPSTALFDQPIRIRLSGLPPGGTVTIHARRGDWRSQASFIADDGGSLDLDRQAPVSGSYDDVDGMGLFWSLTYADPANVNFGQMWGDSLERATTNFRAEIDGETVAEGSVIREYLVPGVRRIVVRDDGLHGVLFLPAAPAPHPAIVIVSGSGGGLNEYRAALYAAHGIAALSLAYFNYEDLPPSLTEIPLEYFETAIHWLQAHPEIDGKRIAFTGNSRGGELSLLLAATFPAIRAVIAYVPSGYVWGGISSSDDKTRAAWTYQGRPLPYVPSVNNAEIAAQNEDLASRHLPIPLTPMFHASLKANPGATEALIPVERINGAALLISGEEDAMWPSATFADVVMERLRQASFPHPYQHLRYPNAGHLILQPYVPTTVLASGHPLRHTYFAYGGTPKGVAFANADSWPKVLRFLEENLKG